MPKNALTNNFAVQTSVNAPFERVWRTFNKNLFYAVQPNFPQVKILRYDGENVGDKVEAELILFGVFRFPFYAEIVQRAITSKEFYFIDEGTRLPFFLKKWQHKHIVREVSENETLIIDDVSFEVEIILLKPFIKFILQHQFLRRRPLYRKYFSQ